ncbi:MAG: flagellar motor switch protein FliM [Alphaproteobacteria bacterium]|jgi:flagellar motor switch protein FliM|nr:flagellar motor switch protein FliM [Alphaproteobacteria bacterium]
MDPDKDETGDMTGPNPALARLLRKSDAAAPDDADALQGAGPGRAIRVALLRAADRAIGLSLTVLGLSDEVENPDALVAEGPAGWVLFGLCAPGETGLAGLVMLDPSLRAAMIEVQTMGVLLDAAEADRPVTATDAALSRPVVAELLHELAGMGRAEFSAGMGDWTLRPLPDLRAAELMLRDVAHRHWQASVQIGGTDRQGALHLALAQGPPADADGARDADSADWSRSLQASLELAPAELEAVLGRLTLPLSKVNGFEVGQVLSLGPMSLGAVRLESAGTPLAGHVRLGQMAGLRAVRLERPPQDMQDLARPGATAPPPDAALAADARPDETPGTGADRPGAGQGDSALATGESL